MLKLSRKYKRATRYSIPRDGVPPTLLAVGPWRAQEFALIRRQLDLHNQWPTAPSLAAATEIIAAASNPPDLILLAQPHPGLEDQSAVDRLLAVAPLTRLITVAGCWCEGELRTGRPLAGAMRLYWHEFAPWWHAALKQLSTGQSPPWSAPLDDPRTARHLTSIGEDPLQRSGSPSRPTPQATVAIDAPDHAVFEALSAAIAPHGWHATWTPRHRPQPPANTKFTAAIWDGAQLNPTELASLKNFAALVPVSRDPKSAQGSAPPAITASTHRAPVIALLDFPRPEHIQLAHAAGVTAVLGKPYSVPALLRELNA